MKKRIIMLIALLCLMCFYRDEVKAIEIFPDSVPNATYIIGEHMFTRDVTDNYDGILTTEYIMLASKTISSEGTSEMKIYYKDPFGVWKNGITGDEIEVEELTFEVSYRNNRELLPAPELKVKLDSKDTENATYTFDLTNVINADILGMIEVDFDPSLIEGWNLYKTNWDGETLNDQGVPIACVEGVCDYENEAIFELIGSTENDTSNEIASNISISVTNPLGSIERYVARTFYKENENVIYSDWSSTFDVYYGLGASLTADQDEKLQLTVDVPNDVVDYRILKVDLFVKQDEENKEFGFGSFMKHYGNFDENSTADDYDEALLTYTFMGMLLGVETDCKGDIYYAAGGSDINEEDAASNVISGDYLFDMRNVNNTSHTYFAGVEVEIDGVAYKIYSNEETGIAQMPPKEIMETTATDYSLNQ